MLQQNSDSWFSPGTVYLVLLCWTTYQQFFNAGEKVNESCSESVEKVFLWGK